MTNKTDTNKLRMGLYQYLINFSNLPILFVIIVLTLPTISYALDTDNDGVDDSQDNCIEIISVPKLSLPLVQAEQPACS